MSLHRWFRLLGYLTLGLSCAALVFAEAPFLPDLPICLPPVLALLLLAWWIEGRWRLPNWGANILGAFIAAGGAAWLVTQLTDDDSLLAHVPLHLALLPYMGPLVMAALLVKVFGPRDAGDFWRLQGLGLMQVGLGCVLDGGPVFGGLLAGYLASALACLALRYRLSTLGARPERSAWWLLSFTPRWTLLIAVPALLLFLLTPRRDTSAWEPLNSFRAGSNRSRVQGGSEEINLNGTGRIELDDEIALQVIAVDAAGQPKLDLPADQRWRGAVLDWYEKGKWRTMHAMPVNPWRRGQHELPDFGPGQFFLTFTVQPRQAGSLVLADPIRFGPPEARLPVRTLSEDDRPRLFQEQAGTVMPLQANERRTYRYCQVAPAPKETSRIFAEGVRSGSYMERLSRQHVPGLQEWTFDLLRRLVSLPRYRLPQGVRSALAQPPDSFLLDPDHWESVARALTDYLASSGEFTYSLNITRHDPSLDPVMDFLSHVKQGHCERYATALALMLRALSIPARVIKGFHGFDPQGGGSYLVRHRHAHAWVEILVPHTNSRPHTYDWLTLDPTPAESAASESSLSLAHLWEDIQQRCLQSWQFFIVEYNADEQADLWEALKSGRGLRALVKLSIAVAVSVAVFAAWLLLRRWPRRRRAQGDRVLGTASFYPRLVRILERHASLRPRFGQTPREYGEAARAFLLMRPPWVALAELPLRVTDLFYRVRFGGKALSEEERQVLDAELDRFVEALRQPGAS